MPRLQTLVNQWLRRRVGTQETGKSEDAVADQSDLLSPEPAGRARTVQEHLQHLIQNENLSSAGRFDLLRQLGNILVPGYRYNWPQLAWWQDQEFNQYLRRFGEIDGMNTNRRWMLHQLLRLTEGIPGETAECGVYSGASSYLICQANQRVSGTERWHHMFDSFEGLSQPGELDGTHWTEGDLCCSLEKVQRNLSGFGHLSYFQGWIPERFGEIGHKAFAFVHIDVDLHEPTRHSLEFFYPRVVPGGIILCDDYGFTTCPGATKAIDDFLRDKSEKMVGLSAGGGFLVKGSLTAAVPPHDDG